MKPAGAGEELRGRAGAAQREWGQNGVKSAVDVSRISGTVDLIQRLEVTEQAREIAA
jgi:hypothetical protein